MKCLKHDKGGLINIKSIADVPLHLVVADEPYIVESGSEIGSVESKEKEIKVILK